MADDTAKTQTVDAPKKTDRELKLEAADKKIADAQVEVTKANNAAVVAHDKLTQALREKAAI